MKQTPCRLLLMMATQQQIQQPVEAKLPTGAYQPQQSQASQDILSLMQKMVSKPTLATGTAVLPQPMNVQTPELLATGGVATTTPTATATQAGAPTAITAGTVSIANDSGASPLLIEIAHQKRIL